MLVVYGCSGTDNGTAPRGVASPNKSAQQKTGDTLGSAGQSSTPSAIAAVVDPSSEEEIAGPQGILDTTRSHTSETGSKGDSVAGATGLGGVWQSSVVGGNRPAKVYVPEGDTTTTALPLVIALHGYTDDGKLIEDYLQLGPLVHERRFLYVHPDGTPDPLLKLRFWNATGACCDFEHTNVDDEGYLLQIINEIKARYPVDPKRVYLIGHSNGGFFSYRMACHHASMIAAIISVDGATYADSTECKPSEPVTVLQIHGEADKTVLYQGGILPADIPLLGHAYPSAPDTVKYWAHYDGCNPMPTVFTPPSVSYDNKITGLRYDGCKRGSHVELWAIANASHVPPISKTFASVALNFFYAHAKP